MNIKELFSSFKKEDFFQNVNLHIHSTHSDGERSFDELINQAKKLNLKCFSITDHNSVSGYKDKDLSEIPNLIKGVEFDCFYKMSLLHILGYNIDINNKELLNLCAKNELEQKFNCELKELSMGMSQDYKIAVKHGATMLRIGRKLFK